MKILLTGSTGFLGRYFYTFFKDRYDVTALSHADLNLEDPILVTEFLKNTYFDIVIHTAVTGRELVQSIDKNIAEKNLQMFFNLYSNREHYGRFINFGSGAEFGLDRDIDLFHEDEIFTCFPKESYGFSKNIIARVIRNTDKFYNLRVFSCFDSSETDNRLLKKFIKSAENNRVFTVDQDRYVDFISLTDLAKVTELVIQGKILNKDFNVVYKEKLLVSDTLKLFAAQHGIDVRLVTTTATKGKSYTGNGELLDQYKISLDGLEKSLANYQTKLVL
jgi:dTDP-4-dehydrorhamnose reductase